MQTPADPAYKSEIRLLPLLRRAERSITSHLVGRLREAGFAGLTATHGNVFPYIEPDGSRVADMARRAGVTKQTMAEFVLLLEQQGYVERRPDPIDQRAKLVALTPLGVDVVRVAGAAIREAEAQWELVIGADEMTRLRDLLAKAPTAAQP
jgi:DNA-binding MarR family transcriptional regulator